MRRKMKIKRVFDAIVSSLTVLFLAFIILLPAIIVLSLPSEEDSICVVTDNAREFIKKGKANMEVE